MITLILLPIILLPLSPGHDSLALFRKLGDSPVPGLRIQAIRSLRGQEGDVVRAALVSFLGDKDASVVAAARKEIVARPSSDSDALVRAVAGLRSVDSRRAGVRALLRRGDDLTPFATDRSALIRARVVHAGRVGPKARTRLLGDPDPLVRAYAVERVGDAADAKNHVRSPHVPLRIAAVRTTTDASIVAHLLRDRSWRVRLAAILAAERLRHRGTVPALIEVLGEPPGRLRARCVVALESLTGASHGTSRDRWRAWWKRATDRFEVRPRRAPRANRDRTVSTLSFRRLPVVSRRVIFVLDASKSMAKPAPHMTGKSRWDLVVSDVVGVLRRLPKGSRFNVILLRTGVTAWKPRLARASPGSARSCAEWISGQSPAGWTNLFDSLARALEDKHVETVYVLTDGVPSRGAETRRTAILDEIDFLNRYRMVQIHCVQAGSARGLGKRWSGFLDELADAHDGICVRE